MKKLLLTILFLFITNIAFADTAIYCPKCKQHLYNYKKEIIKGEQVKTEDFEPTRIDIPKLVDGEDMVCPFDKRVLNGWDFWGKSQKFKSFSMAYPAISLLTKDENGKFIWVPWDIPMLNMNEDK